MKNALKCGIRHFQNNCEIPNWNFLKSFLKILTSLIPPTSRYTLQPNQKKCQTEIWVQKNKRNWKYSKHTIQFEPILVLHMLIFFYLNLFLGRGGSQAHVLGSSFLDQGLNPGLLALRVQNPNHWTTREFSSTWIFYSIWEQETVFSSKKIYIIFSLKLLYFYLVIESFQLQFFVRPDLVWNPSVFWHLKKYWVLKVKAGTDRRAKRKISLSYVTYHTHLIPVSKDELSFHNSHSTGRHIFIYINLIHLLSSDYFSSNLNVEKGKPSLTVSLKEAFSQRLFTTFCMDVGGFSKSSKESINIKSKTTS